MRKIIFVAMVLTLWLYATPVTLNNMGLITKLEKFTPICEYYSDIFKDKYKIKRLCREYGKGLKNVLQSGYRMDKYIIPTTHTHMYQGKMHTCTNQAVEIEIVEDGKVLGKILTCYNGTFGETIYSYKMDAKILDKYRLDAFNLNKLREKIIEYIGKEKIKARASYDVVYHEKLIRKYIIKLYNCDKIFIAEHREVYDKENNPRYIQMVIKDAEALWSKKQIMIVAKIKQDADKKKRREYEEWMEKCGNKMTAVMHHEGMSGKISGRVESSQPSGYLLKSYGGPTFFVQGGPLYTVGEYVDNIYVVTPKEDKRTGTTSTDRRTGVKTKAGMALVVDYNPWCE